MNTTAARNSASGSLANRILWFAVLALGAYFVIEYVPQYFNLTEESYGSYFWPRANYLFPHVVGGLIAIVIGPFQFWSKLRSEHPKIHRITGRIYLLAILVGAVGGIAMSLTAYDNLGYSSGLFFLAVAWLTTATMALIAIRNRNIKQHKEWMIRSFVVTFAFVSFRIIDDILDYYAIWDGDDRNAMLAWICWAVPLLFTEVVLQSKQVFRGR